MRAFLCAFAAAACGGAHAQTRTNGCGKRPDILPGEHKTVELTTMDGIKAFTAGGYAFDPDLSEGDKITFVRPYPQPA